MPRFKIGKSRLIVDDWSNVKYVQACATRWELDNVKTGQWILQEKLNQITKEHEAELDNFCLVGYEHDKQKDIEIYRAMYVKYGHFTWGNDA